MSFQGCVASVEDMIRDNIDIIVGCSAGVLVLQVRGVSRDVTT